MYMTIFLIFRCKCYTPEVPQTSVQIQILQYKFKLRQNFDLNLYHEILRDLSFLIWWSSGVVFSSGKCHRDLTHSLSSWCVDDSSHSNGVISYSSQVFSKNQPQSPFQSRSDGFEEPTNRSRPIDNVLALHSLSTTHMGNQWQMILRLLKNLKYQPYSDVKSKSGL